MRADCGCVDARKIDPAAGSAVWKYVAIVKASRGPEPGRAPGRQLRPAGRERGVPGRSPAHGGGHPDARGRLSAGLPAARPPRGARVHSRSRGRAATMISAQPSTGIGEVIKAGQEGGSGERTTAFHRWTHHHHQQLGRTRDHGRALGSRAARWLARCLASKSAGNRIGARRQDWVHAVADRP